MTIITEVRFAHEDSALAGTLAALPDLDVTVIREASTAPGLGVSVMRFDHESREELAAVLAEDHTVAAVTEMPGVESEQRWGIEFASTAKLLSPRVTEAGGYVLDARSASGQGSLRGWRERWLLPDREALQGIWEESRGLGFEFEILELHLKSNGDAAYLGADALTAEQREALVAAYELGYFAEPRQASLEVLAESLGLSPTAVAGRLRRGLRSLVGTTLAVERPEQ